MKGRQRREREPSFVDDWRMRHNIVTGFPALGVGALGAPGPAVTFPGCSSTSSLAEDMVFPSDGVQSSSSARGRGVALIIADPGVRVSGLLSTAAAIFGDGPPGPDSAGSVVGPTVLDSILLLTLSLGLCVASMCHPFDMTDITFAAIVRSRETHGDRRANESSSITSKSSRPTASSDDAECRAHGVDTSTTSGDRLPEPGGLHFG
ncbi:unnamed protein product [Notodromas monacha]|uniref:Uncharacterized protein n=1 Tax=Notodromas monacha TaxID=399045 RepID=A0A7R9GBJ1_9CRUS|nr:unnamed protein product [Notodromas monacha]CAG0915052.1 unnamed protein product [Notodromas monacha]